MKPLVHDHISHFTHLTPPHTSHPLTPHTPSHLTLPHTLTPHTPSQSKLSSLVSLDLYNCPITLIDKYREQVFELLPSLNSLDGLDQSGEEVDDSEEEGMDNLLPTTVE